MPRTIFSLFISYFASKNDYFLENLAYMQKKVYLCTDFRKLTGFFGAIAKKIKQILDITGQYSGFYIQKVSPIIDIIFSNGVSPFNYFANQKQTFTWK